MVPSLVELTIRPEVIDPESSEDCQRLLDHLADVLGEGESPELAISRRYPEDNKLLVETTPAVAGRLARAGDHGDLSALGIVRAFVCPTSPPAEEDLDFTRRDMVKWFTPLELIRAGVKSFLSTLFGSYADRRELQALQASRPLRSEAPVSTAAEAAGSPAENNSNPEADTLGLDELYDREVTDLSDRAELWLDYTADLGDGWDSTYTIARLLSESSLELTGGANTHSTSRGDVLVMGGDQVYPTATRQEYQDRLVGPYRSALPCVIGQDPPQLFAIPGNHDWYDGLTSFTRLFCQQRWIGGWRTRQRRSYFAVKLPHDWWLWGIDVQLDSDIDLPQFEYFERLAKRMKPGAKIILCTAESSWVYAEQKGPEAYQNLDYFERKIIQAHDHNLVIGLAGDLHTYARYESRGAARGNGEVDARANDETVGPRQRFTAGGGGAYMYPSHQLPERLDLPASDRDSIGDRRDQNKQETYDQEAVFPDKDRSSWLSLGALALPIRNPSFGAVLGFFYLLFAWIVQSETKIPFAAQEAPGSFLERLHDLPYLALGSIGEMFEYFWIVLRHSPGTVVLLLLLAGGLIAFADRKGGLQKTALGLLHTGGHVTLALVLMWTFAELNMGHLGLAVDAPLQVALFMGEMLLVGGLLGGVVFGLYLLLSNLILSVDRPAPTGASPGESGAGERPPLKGVHANEVFSSQAIADYKSFVRLHIREDGDLVIFPVGVEKVCRSWLYNANASNGRSWYDPLNGPLSERAKLIEDPIVISRGRRSDLAAASEDS